MGKPSILALCPSLVHWFWKSNDSMDQPDLQGVFRPASYKQGLSACCDDYPGMTCGVWQHRPESTDYVRARSADPFQDPIIQPNYLADPMDREVLVRGMKLGRRLLHTPELASYFDGDMLPGPQVQSDDEFLDYARQYGSTSYHLIGHRADWTGDRSGRRGGRPVGRAWGCRVCASRMRRPCRPCHRPIPTRPR
jgi:choline dehydrogenase